MNEGLVVTVIFLLLVVAFMSIELSSTHADKSYCQGILKAKGWDGE